jgi:hypothetical protein
MARHASRSLVAPILSAILLYLFVVGFRVFAAAMVPLLVELWERSPRLGALGWLGLLSSPIAFVALAHRAVHRVIDPFDRDGAAPARFVSLRAGLFAWFAGSFASMATTFLLLAIFPPPPDEETLAALVRVAADVRLQAGIHTLLWIGVAALLYHVDGAAERRRA